MKDFILELYSEEIPAGMQKNAESDFHKIFEDFFKNFELKYEGLNVNVGPCRIVISCFLQEILQAKKIELKGPKVDAPQAAIEGFCKSNNITKDQLVEKELKEQKFYFAYSEKPEQTVAEIMIKHLPDYLNRISWPKSMVWGSSNFYWVRPLKNILCMLGEEIVELTFGNLKANNISYGHKFMDHKALKIKNKNDYLEKLRSAKVVVSRHERENIIRAALTKLCNELGIILNEDPKLLEEVCGLAELPQLLQGNIADKFLSLPREVLITSMRTHQKYFTANTKDGKLAPYFFFVTNLKLDDYSEVIKGNERVLAARLSDALYFYNLDKENKLENNLDKLKNVIFHAKLGSIADKVNRIVKLTSFIAPFDNNAKLASSLAKCDLLSEMVGEFPELQGIMGSYYANTQGHNTEVCEAIKNHYKPQGADDEVPVGSAAILAISDKLDSLVSLYLSGERATSSKDPYALRRYALGMIRTILTNKLDINILKAIELAASNTNLPYSDKELGEILLFIEERFKFFLKNHFAQDVVNSVIDLAKNPNLVSQYTAIESLDKVMNQSSGKELLSLYKRAKNILEGNIFSKSADEDLFQSDSEKELNIRVKGLSSRIGKSLESKDFASALNLLMELNGPLAHFFDKNLVNTEDINITYNRKSLLAETARLFTKVANFDELQ